MRIAKLMKLHRLLKPAGEEGSDAGGTNTGAGEGSGEGQGSKAGEGEGEQGKAEGEGEGKGAAAGDGQGQGKGPTDAEVKLLRDLMKQKQRAEKLEADLAALKAVNSKFDGIDADAVRKMLADRQEAEEAASIARGDFERVRAQMATRHAEETAALKSEIEAGKTNSNTLKGQIADLTIGGQFSKSEFISKELTLTPAKARVIYGSHFDFVDGKVVGYDKPAGASDRTMLVDASGSPLTFDSALTKIVEADTDPDKDLMLRSRSRRGAGSGTQTKGAKTGSEQGGKSLTAIERISAGLKEIAKKQ